MSEISGLSGIGCHDWEEDHSDARSTKSSIGCIIFDHNESFTPSKVDISYSCDDYDSHEICEDDVFLAMLEQRRISHESEIHPAVDRALLHSIDTDSDHKPEEEDYNSHISLNHHHKSTRSMISDISSVSSDGGGSTRSKIQLNRKDNFIESGNDMRALQHLNTWSEGDSPPVSPMKGGETTPHEKKKRFSLKNLVPKFMRSKPKFLKSRRRSTVNFPVNFPESVAGAPSSPSDGRRHFLRRSTL